MLKKVLLTTGKIITHSERVYKRASVATIIVATDAFNLQGIIRLCRRRQLRHRHTLLRTGLW